MTVSQIRHRANLIAEAAIQGLDKVNISLLIVGLMAEQTMDLNGEWIEGFEVKSATINKETRTATFDCVVTP